MNNYDAIAIAEGLVEADQETQLEAWQHLINTGIVWQLQGTFGRPAKELIQNGHCQLPTQPTIH